MYFWKSHTIFSWISRRRWILKSFENCSETKWKKSKEFQYFHFFTEIVYAASIKLRKKNQTVTTKLLIKHIYSLITSSPILKYDKFEILQSQMSSEETLSLIITLDLLRETYDNLHSTKMHEH